MRKEKLYEFKASWWLIILYITPIFFGLGVILYYFTEPLVGYIIMGMPIVYFVIFLIAWVLLGYYVRLNDEYVSYRWSTIFNFKICKEKWTDLQYVEKRGLSNVEGDTPIFHTFFCLYFRYFGMEAFNIKTIRKMKQENGVIIILDTERNRRILREYLPEQFKYVLD